MILIIGKDWYDGLTGPAGRRQVEKCREDTDSDVMRSSSVRLISASHRKANYGCRGNPADHEWEDGATNHPIIAPGPYFIIRSGIKEDAMKLAHLIEERKDEKLPLVPLPSEQEMEWRKTLASYGREVRNRTKQINTLHAMFVHQGHTTVVRKDLATADRRRQAVDILRGQDREEAEYILKHLELHEQRLEEMRKKIKKESKTDENMKRLQSIAGVGPIVAYAFVAHVGDGSRFSTGAQVSNFIGFVPRLDYSGTIQHSGPITKHGNGYLRGLLVQAAWSAVRSKTGGALQERYKYKTAGQGTSKKKTIVSIGRRLAEIMYSVLRNKTEYEPRQWKGVINKTAVLAEQAMNA